MLILVLLRVLPNARFGGMPGVWLSALSLAICLEFGVMPQVG